MHEPAYTAVERHRPGGAPTAFRIWRAGENPTDLGPVVFSQRSAELLLEQQERRGNLIPIDLDHLSLDRSAPMELRGAVGWMQLEVRPDAEGNPELWAVGCQWSEMARKGLESSPAAWRYFSPVFERDEATNEVVGFVNLALTNNPATHRVTTLAASQTSALRIPHPEEVPVSEATLRRQIEQLTRDVAELKGAFGVAPAPARPPRTAEDDRETYAALDRVFDNAMMTDRRMIKAHVERQGSTVSFTYARPSAALSKTVKASSAALSKTVQVSTPRVEPVRPDAAGITRTATTVTFSVADADDAERKRLQARRLALAAALVSAEDQEVMP